MPGPGQIRIRIGASVDASLEKSFETAEKRAEQAAQRIRRAQTKGAGDAARAAEQAARAQEQGQERVARMGRKAADDWARSLKQIGKVAEQELTRQARAMSRADRMAGESFARRTSHRATRFLMPNAPLGSMASRAMRDIARGVGVDTSFSGALQRVQSLQSASVGIAQQERIATGGSTRGAKYYEGVAREQSMKLGQDPDQVMAMMRAFSGKTGEFSKLNEMVARLGPLAAASGTGFEDMAMAAGAFYNQVKALPNALELTEEGMRGIIGQTAVGSVEMPDFAKFFGRAAAGAPKFGKNRAETMNSLAAMAQMSIESGGASSAAEATTATRSFVEAFGKKGNLNSLKKAGIQVWEDPGSGAGKNTTLRNPFAIIKDMLRKTGGNVPALAQLMPEMRGKKPIDAALSAYNSAGGGEAGLKAYDEAVQKYTKTTLDAATVEKNMADHMAETATKAKVFQQRLDMIAEKVADKLIPSLEKAAPDILRFVETLGNLATWMVDNPKKTIAAALTFSIMRALGESSLRSGIERLILGPSGERTVGVGKVAGTIGSVAAVAAIAVTAEQLGEALIDYFANKAVADQNARIGKEGEAGSEASQAAQLHREGKDEEAAKVLQGAIGKNEENIAGRKEDMTGFWRMMGDTIVGALGGKDADDAFAARTASEKRSMDQQTQELTENKALLQQINSALQSGITVKVQGGDGRAPQ